MKRLEWKDKWEKFFFFLENFILSCKKTSNGSVCQCFCPFSEPLSARSFVCCVRESICLFVGLSVFLSLGSFVWWHFCSVCSPDFLFLYCFLLHAGTFAICLTLIRYICLFLSPYSFQSTSLSIHIHFNLFLFLPISISICLFVYPYSFQSAYLSIHKVMSCSPKFLCPPVFLHPN